MPVFAAVTATAVTKDRPVEVRRSTIVTCCRARKLSSAIVYRARLAEIQAIAAAGVRHQVAGPRRVLLDLLPELPHVRPQILRAGGRFRTPYGREDLLLGHGPTRASRERKKQLALERRDVNLPSLHEHGA